MECRTASGRWIRKIAADSPRYDEGNSIGRRVFLTVPVLVEDRAAWLAAGHRHDWVNWPAEDVRAAEGALDG